MDCLGIAFTVLCASAGAFYLFPIIHSIFKRLKTSLIVGSYAFAFVLSLSALLCDFFKESGNYYNYGGALFAHIFLAISLLVFFLGIIVTIIKRQWRLLIFFACIVSSTFLLQLSLCLAGISAPITYDYAIGGIAQVFSQTLQTISLDLPYTEIISDGFGLFKGYSCYIFITMACILTIVAPVSGGCALFDLLSHYFPKAELFFFSFKRTRYVFSELNERSIETAESIYQSILEGKEGVDYSSLIIFTDAYTDDEEERSSELLVRAKKIGAICLREDIREVKLRWFFFPKTRKVCYFLMDKKEENNLSATVALMSADVSNPWAKFKKQATSKTESNQPTPTKFRILLPKLNIFAKIKNCRPVNLIRAQKMSVYVFTSDCEASELLKNAQNSLTKEQDLEVAFKVINEYKNLVYRLIDGYGYTEDVGGNRHNYPLYWSLLRENDKPADLNKLSVVIVGGGRIGKEFFKAAYWCGQMLASTKANEEGDGLPYTPTKLSITVIDKNATETERRLRFEMPEVFDRKCASYCTFNFCNAEYGEAEGKADDFSEIFRTKCGNADYVLVALGNDELNLQAAHWIKRNLDIINICAQKNVPINYVIEDAELLNSLVLEQAEADNGKCILNPFGSLKEHYSLDNIKMTEPEKRAYSVNNAHSSYESESEFLAKDYERNSSIASAMHLPYKLVCYLNSGAIGELAKSGKICGMAYSEISKLSENLNSLYWLEHRRWCAYNRANGWRCHTAKEFFALAFDENNCFIKDKQKESHLLHACLVESGKEIKADLEKLKFNKTKPAYIADGKNIAADCGLEEWLSREIKCDACPDMDALDKLSWLTGKAFKDYDINVVLSLCADEYRREIIDNINHLLNEKETTNYIHLVEEFIKLYNQISISQSESHKQEDFFSTDNINFYRQGIYKDFELAILESKDGAEISAVDILSKLKGCPELIELITDCKNIENLKHLTSGMAFIIYIKSEQDSKKKYALLGLPLTASIKKKKGEQKLEGNDEVAQNDAGEQDQKSDKIKKRKNRKKGKEEISINFKFLSSAIAASCDTVAGADGEDTAEAAIADGEKADI